MLRAHPCAGEPQVSTRRPKYILKMQLWTQLRVAVRKALDRIRSDFAEHFGIPIRIRRQKNMQNRDFMNKYTEIAEC